MEISIDLKFLREICFGNEELLRDMAEEWCSDTIEKMESIKKMQAQGASIKLFNRLHELKTNFTMIRCPYAIQSSEKMLSKLEHGAFLHAEEIEILDNLCTELQKLVNDTLTNPTSVTPSN